MRLLQAKKNLCQSLNFATNVIKHIDSLQKNINKKVRPIERRTKNAPFNVATHFPLYNKG